MKRFVKVCLHCIVNNLKRISKLSTLRTPGRISVDAHGKGDCGHSNESLPITATRNTAERSFSKLSLIKTFHRSTMTVERIKSLPMLSIESESAKTLDMTELTKKSHF